MNYGGKYIPNNETTDMEREFWKSVHSKKKYAFSKTLTKLENGVLIKDNISPLFIDINQRLGLKLVDTRSFSSGVVQLSYHPTNK